MEDVSSLRNFWSSVADSFSAQSTALNTSRITVLRSRNDQLEALFEEASKRVVDLSSGDSYSSALENLILEVSLIINSSFMD